MRNVYSRGHWINVKIVRKNKLKNAIFLFLFDEIMAIIL
jgi:hypothetical protein